MRDSSDPPPEKSNLPPLPVQAQQLALAIHGNMDTAAAVASIALARLPAAVVAQDKRVYYGRDDPHTRPTKVWLGREHVLQQLVFAASDPIEREDESQRPLGATELQVRFVKHLVWMSTRRNVFYVTLAVARLLYGFRMSETAQLYALLAEEGAKDDAYCRARKRVLVDEMLERFPRSLRVAIGKRGDRGIAMKAADDAASARVAHCLESFAPWGVGCRGDSADPLHLMHRLLHRPCFATLLTELGWPDPLPRVQVPTTSRRVL